MTVPAAFELHHLGPSRMTARQTNGRHRGLRARIDHPYHFDRRHHLTDKLCQFDFGRGRCTKARPPRRNIFQRVDNRWKRVPVNQGAPGEDVVDIAVPIDVINPRTLAPFDEQWIAPDGSKCAGGAVHTPRNDSIGLLKKRF